MEEKKANPVLKYFAESKSELQKVSWPSRRTIVNHTLMVIGLSVGLAIFIGAIDYILTMGVEKIIK